MHTTITKESMNGFRAWLHSEERNEGTLLQIVVHDVVIAESALLLPGYQVTTLELENRTKLSAGEYEGKIVVSYYQPDSREKTILLCNGFLNACLEKQMRFIHLTFICLTETIGLFYRGKSICRYRSRKKLRQAVLP